MNVKHGDEVFLALASASAGVGGRPHSSVRRAVCIDAENRVFKDDDGTVTVINSWSVETCCPTEAAAWRHCADVLRAQAGGIELAAEECLRKAGAALAEEATVAG